MSSNPSIAVLDDHVVNQIAAGEVIERPVAVVKELLENSIDAGSSRISVEFRHGGKSYIQVQDNGSGMIPDEMHLSLRRHATSKIKITDDLMRVRSFGFRGEAIPSIASVSRFIMRSRSASQKEGHQVIVDAGKLKSEHPCGMPVGTCIEISHLFHAVPVRRKFLKTDNTESAHIIQLIRLYSIAHPEITFELVQDSRTILKSPAGDSMEERIGTIWGAQLSEQMWSLPVVTDTEQNIELSGRFGKPGLSRSSRQDLITIVNGRPVDSRTLSYAVIESYHTYIPKGRYPIAFLFLSIDPSLIDVNVHPAKREIRFRNEGPVRHFVITRLLKFLQQDRHIASSKSLKEAPPLSPPSPKIAPPQSPFHKNSNKPSTYTTSEVVIPNHHSDNREIKDRIVPRHSVSTLDVDNSSSTTGNRLDVDQVLCYLTRFGDDGVIFQAQDGLLLGSVNAIQERILFERLQHAFTQEKNLLQDLLLPITLELEPRLSALLDGAVEFLRKQGFNIENFGRNFYRVGSIPNWMEPEVVEPFIIDLLSLLQDEKIKLRENTIIFEKVARRAVQFAKKDPISWTIEFMNNLLQQLFLCKNPYNSPSGRSTFFEISSREIRKRMGIL